ncbi:ATP-binding protein [Streptomyces scabiei]|uniref:ATP-binding protein n=1 Tax=Streptomyces scabiei TaxID=1930 RepID=UPI002990790E|nr:ATP-binding protein [Streptomyces scabiei]MDW8804366.1 ATP-binding protein [Streptomyces scabiei]
MSPAPENWTPGQEPGPRLCLAWQSGGTETVTVAGADVVRVTQGIGVQVLAILRQQGIPLGPALHTRPRQAVEFVVPAGTAQAWPDLPFTTCTAGAEIRPPAPDVTALAGRRVAGRTWFVAPGAEEVSTDPDALAEAIACVQRENRRTAADHGAHQAPDTALTEGRVSESSPRGSAPVEPLVWRDIRPIPPQAPASRPVGAPNSTFIGLTWALPGGDVRTVPDARRRVADGCRMWRLPREVAADLCTIVSELAANAVQHTDSAEIVVALYLARDDASVVVTDQGPARGPLTASQADEGAERGRGLALVEALATRWETLPAGDGKAVCARIILPSEYRETPHSDEDDHPDARS